MATINFNNLNNNNNNNKNYNNDRKSLTNSKIEENKDSSGRSTKNQTKKIRAQTSRVCPAFFLFFFPFPTKKLTSISYIYI